MSTKQPFSLIISDLHLSASHQEATRCFMSFMQHDAPKAEKLFILGDFFEFWLGDDDQCPFNQQIMGALKNLSSQGVKLYFIHGNRDFLIGKRFAIDANITILPDPYVIDLYGQSILLSHGDLFCTDDIAYQRLRRVVHIKYLQRLFLALPLIWRLKIARIMRQKIDATHKPASIMDVNNQAILNTFKQHQINAIIHGHTHKRNTHRYSIDGKTKCRYVLGDWQASGSALKVDAKGIVFIGVMVKTTL